MLFDDIDKGMCPEDQEAFASFSHAHCHVANHVLRNLGPRRLLFCPTEYCTSRAEPTIRDSVYLNTLGSSLDPSIQVLWTGDAVIPEYITPESLQAVNAAIGRKCVIWDNIHANDYDPRRVYLGPYAGRPARIADHVQGVLTNPNCQYSLNFVALHSMAAWHRLGAAYDERVAFRQAVTDWVSRIAQGGTGKQAAAVGVDAMMKLCDMFYLPFHHGTAASTLIASFLWLEDTPATGACVRACVCAVVCVCSCVYVCMYVCVCVCNCVSLSIHGSAHLPPPQNNFPLPTSHSPLPPP